MMVLLGVKVTKALKVVQMQKAIRVMNLLVVILSGIILYKN
jgi:hypothetical protein